MSKTPRVAREAQYWREQRASYRRAARLMIQFYGALSSFVEADVDATAGNPTASLATCEKVPTSAREDDEPTEREPDEPDYPETVEDAGFVSDATEALQASLAREPERQRKIEELVMAGEVSHAKRFALCERQSVELECGSCSQSNFVPATCDSRICDECMRRRMGRVIEKFRGIVESWDNPTMIRLSLDDRVGRDALDEGVDRLRDFHSKLRRRVVQPEGEFQKRRWVWNNDGGEPANCWWARQLRRAGRHDLARRWQRRYVEQDKGIPFDEIVSEGFYGIDIKQTEDLQFNVHMHILADVPYLPQGALSAVWDDIAGAPVVDIRRIYDDQSSMDGEDAIAEVVGYASKAPEFESVKDEVSYLQTLKGSPLIQPFGDLHGNTNQATDLLRCSHCEVVPPWWGYLGFIDHGHDSTIELDGDSADGDRPPD